MYREDKTETSQIPLLTTLKPLSSKRKQQTHLNSKPIIKQAGNIISEEPPTPASKKNVSFFKFNENQKTKNSKHPIQLKQQNTQEWQQKTLETPINHRTENPGIEGGGEKRKRAVLKTRNNSKGIHSRNKEKKTNLAGKGRRKGKRRRERRGD